MRLSKHLLVLARGSRRARSFVDGYSSLGLLFLAEHRSHRPAVVGLFYTMSDSSRKLKMHPTDTQPTEAQILDFSAFMESALRTENVVEEGTLYPMTKYLAILNLVETGSRVLDLMKRELYYSKLDSTGARAFKGFDPAAMQTMLDDIKSQVRTIESELTCVTSLPSLPNADGSPGFPIRGTGVAAIPTNTRLAHGIIGKCGEAGELVREWLESIVDNRPVDSAKLAGELGDGGWFDAVIVDSSGLNLPVAYWAIIKKLKLRYPDAFKSELAYDRNVGIESQAVAVFIAAAAQ